MVLVVTLDEIYNHVSNILEKPPISINSSTKWFEFRTVTDPLWGKDIFE